MQDETITYVGGPIDGRTEERPKGVRLALYRGDTGLTINTNSGAGQLRKIEQGRPGNRHYMRRRTSDGRTVYVHFTVLLGWTP